MGQVGLALSCKANPIEKVSLLVYYCSILPRLRRKAAEMTTEPVRNANAIALAVQGAIIALLTAAASLGWVTISPEQMGAIEKAVMAFLGLAVLAVPPIVATFWARSKVVPLASLPPQVAADVVAQREAR